MWENTDIQGLELSFQVYYKHVQCLYLACRIFYNHSQGLDSFTTHLQHILQADYLPLFVLQSDLQAFNLHLQLPPIVLQPLPLYYSSVLQAHWTCILCIRPPQNTQPVYHTSGVL